MQAEEKQKTAEKALQKEWEAAATQDQEQRHFIDARNGADTLLCL